MVMNCNHDVSQEFTAPHFHQFTVCVINTGDRLSEVQ